MRVGTAVFNYPFLTLKERDIETGLDYFGARYFASIQGRFTSSDPLLSSGRIENPQSWNRYSYTLNNPLSFIDPTGLFTIDTKDETQRKQIVEAYNALQTALQKLPADSKAYKSIERSLQRLGKPGEANGIVVTVGKTDPNDAGEIDVNKIEKGIITITFNADKFLDSAEKRAAVLGHEGVHADDALNLFSALKKSSTAFTNAWNGNDHQYRTEYDAHWVDAGVYQVLGREGYTYGHGIFTPPTIPGKAQSIPVVGEYWNRLGQHWTKKRSKANKERVSELN